MDTIAAPRTARRRLGRRGWYLTAGLLLTVAVGAAVVASGVPLWIALTAAVAPDVALLAGMGAGLARGRLHPRAVPLYNALHALPAPAALAAAGLALGQAPVAVAAAAWLAHIAFDRAAGYGLRRPDGSLR